MKETQNKKDRIHLSLKTAKKNTYLPSYFLIINCQNVSFRSTMKLDIAQNTMYKDFVISNDFDFTKVNVFNCLKF